MTEQDVCELFRFEASENLSVEDSAYYLINDDTFHVQVCLGETYGGTTSYVEDSKLIPIAFLALRTPLSMPGIF